MSDSPDDKPALNPEQVVAPGLPSLSPDAGEQDEVRPLDNVVPTAGYKMAPMIGLGASAGGLPALQQFFSQMPPNSGIIFVVIMHLSPDNESALPELLQRTTMMPVIQVRARQAARADHVYIIPPSKHLSIEDGHIVLTELVRVPGRRIAIDLFLRSLADTRGPHGAAVILSGADADGAIGIKRMKERGGLTIAQDPGEAQHAEMPRSAIATGMVDWVLKVADMPSRLLKYWRTEQRLRLPPEDEPSLIKIVPHGEAEAEEARGELTLRDILTSVRRQTGRDFSYYKRATILRRLGRRMQVNGIEDSAEYLDFLRTNPGEGDALLQDLLISVTNFFRDREFFNALEVVIPKLFQDKGPGDSVRVWVPACATGEEAYSIAILLCEHAAKLRDPPTVQVFATDLDDSAIRVGRTAVYPDTIAADVSEERLRHYFTHSRGNFAVRREVREFVLFASHDVLKDSPFSRLELISCRNLLIYLNNDAQKRALEIFHFALRHSGILFLGSSETADEQNTLFAPLDKRHRIYQRGGVVRGTLPLPGPGFSRFELGQLSTVPTIATVARPNFGSLPTSAKSPVRDPSLPPDLTWNEVHFRSLERLSPPSLIVNEDYEIVHLSEHAERFLRFGGEASMNLLRVAHASLRVELRAALFRATQSTEDIEVRDLPFERDGQRLKVSLLVAPSRGEAVRHFLIVFKEEPGSSLPPHPVDTEQVPAVQALEREVDELRDQLQATIEQSAASGEELKASNEELQAINEELRSATEELETSREELQSVNEELSTVNQELRSKIEELGRSNSDLQNLMASTYIATVFLDQKLRIQRYTPPAIGIFSLIPSDVGRPLSDLAHNLDYPGMNRDAERVLEQLTIVETEVNHSDGRFFLARLLPYRADDKIGGVVLTFIDITSRRQTEESLRASEGRFRAVADLVPDLLWSSDGNGRPTWLNQRWSEYTGQNLQSQQNHDWIQNIHPDGRERFTAEFQRAVRSGTPFVQDQRIRSFSGEHRWFIVRAAPVHDKNGEISEWFGAATDIEEMKRTEAKLAASQERLRMVIENAREFAILSMTLERRVLSWSRGAEQILGYAEAEIIGQVADVIFSPEDRATGWPDEEATRALEKGRAADNRWHVRKDGSRFWGSGALMRMEDETGRAIGLVKILYDQTEARRNAEAVEQGRQELIAALREAESAREEAEAAGRAKDHFLAVLSHELRTPLTPVTMAVQTLLRSSDLSAEVREGLEVIWRNVQLERLFIDDLLDLTRISRGRFELQNERVDLHEAVRRAIEVTMPEIESKSQKLDASLEASRFLLSGDFVRLQQVFWNLLKNASKFSGEHTQIRVRSYNLDGGIVVEVNDHGIGVSEETVPQIFDPFAQATPDVAREYGGLGIGLAIAKATVVGMEGSIEVRSAGLGTGATFVVYLPLDRSEN